MSENEPDRQKSRKTDRKYDRKNAGILGISEILLKLTDICRNRRQILLMQVWGTPLGIPKE